jgi:ferric-dicitrate binding protein FerR (iron transport regulator)
MRADDRSPNATDGARAERRRRLKAWIIIGCVGALIAAFLWFGPVLDGRMVDDAKWSEGQTTAAVMRESVRLHAETAPLPPPGIAIGRPCTWSTLPGR